MPLPILFHTAMGVAALASGAANILMAKGTRRHRWTGWVYAGSMTALCASSFLIQELFNRLGVFHVMALLSMATLLPALYFPLRRRHHPNWLAHHYFWILYSYVGLVMASGSHLFSLLPGLSFVLRAGLFWVVPYALGTFLIYRFRRRLLSAPYGVQRA